MGTQVPVRILIVENNPAFRNLYAELIRDLGYEVKVVADATDALARVRNERFDTVVIDIVLPDMDGWQLIAAAIRERPMLRLVAMTGADMEAAHERARALGLPVLQQPFTRVELRDALQEALTSFQRP
jgi:two-component system, cell cycle response regulator CpdR